MSMMRNSMIAMLMVAPAAFAQQAPALTISPVVVASGHFLAENCVSESDPKIANECMCKADITKAQIAGLPTNVMTTINTQLSQVPEQLASESCGGKPAPAPEASVAINMASAKYETVYQSPTALSVLLTYATAGAGAAHPIPGSEGYSFNLTNGKTMDVAALLTPEQLGKVNEFVNQELRKQHGETMTDEARDRIEPYLSDAGCESCTLYYTKDGWNMRFAVYSVAPYSAGEPTITIPTTIIPDPETLIARKK